MILEELPKQKREFYTLTQSFVVSRLTAVSEFMEWSSDPEMIFKRSLELTEHDHRVCVLP